MYMPGNFAVTDRAEIFAFVEANAFGQLISTVKGRLFATHLPFLLAADRTRITTHVAKPNPQHDELHGQEALIILQGPHGYISPGWYSSPGVPTWNYQAVHIYGRCRIFRDPGELRALVDTLARKYEARFATPWEPQYNAAMLDAIVGIDIEITEVECKYKLSQNRSRQDRHQVIRQLRTLGSRELADAMERNGVRDDN